MKNTIKKPGIAILIALAIMGFVAIAQAEMIEGTVQGLTCVTQGVVCPMGQLDPMVAAEKTFVILTMDQNYFIVTNIDRAVLARHVLSKVRVSGTTHSKYKSIEADKFEAYSSGNWKTVWSKEMQQKMDAMLGLGT